MINFKLTQEIINHIFLSLGIKSGSKVGLFAPNLRLSQTIDIEYEKDLGIVRHPMFGGITNLNNTKLRILAADLSVEDDFSVVLAIKVDNYPTHLLRWDKIDSEARVFRLKIDKKIEPATLKVQCNCLIGIESIIDFGKIWEKITEYDDLFIDLLTLCSND